MGTRSGYLLIVTLLIFLPLAFILGKFINEDENFRNQFYNLFPKEISIVDVRMDLHGGTTSSSMGTYLPESNARQEIISEAVIDGKGALEISDDKFGRYAQWIGGSESEILSTIYRYEVKSTAVKYDLDSITKSSFTTPPSLSKYLLSTENIQSNHPEVIALVNELDSANSAIPVKLKSAFDYCVALETVPFKGLTDAVTALRLQQASCNGKSRLFVAACRQMGLPSRLVGGLIMNTGSKRTSHQWAEVFISGFWVPFDTQNNHFASIPQNYLRLYTGDAFLFKHTAGVPFDYEFTIKKKLVLSNDSLSDHKLWLALERAGIPIEMFRFLLLLPIGAAIVAVMRNIVGLKTFGLFLPALIAASMRETGLLIGLSAFLIVIAVVASLNPLLNKWRLLYTPRLVIMLISVIGLFFGFSFLGFITDIRAFAFVTLFPVVIVAITAERLAKRIEDSGYASALSVSGQTLIVIILSYWTMNSTTLEAIFLAFPELFFVLMGLMLVMGRWTGIRALEYYRFRHLKP